jgi:hypothetical protein
VCAWGTGPFSVRFHDPHPPSDCRSRGQREARSSDAPASPPRRNPHPWPGAHFHLPYLRTLRRSCRTPAVSLRPSTERRRVQASDARSGRAAIVWTGAGRTARALGCHCSGPPNPLVGCPRERKRDPDPTGECGCPRGSRSYASSSAPQRARASVTFGPGAEVLPAGSARHTHVTPFPGPKRPEILTFGMLIADPCKGLRDLRHVPLLRQLTTGCRLRRANRHLGARQRDGRSRRRRSVRDADCSTHAHHGEADARPRARVTLGRRPERARDQRRRWLLLAEAKQAPLVLPSAQRRCGGRRAEMLVR